MNKKISIKIPIVFVLMLVITPLAIKAQQKKYHKDLPKTITLTSSDFVAGDTIPIECTGDGQELSPALQWSNMPVGTKSFVLLMTDYDGPAPFFKVMTVDHWIVYNIPTGIIKLKKGSTSAQLQKDSIDLGQNFKKGIEYKGPKPPIGVHKYYFRIYALSVDHLSLNNSTKKEVMEAMKGKILAYGELIGKY